MKLIIDIPEEVLNTIKSFKGKFICKNGYDLIRGIQNGTPFDSVIDDIKAEISEPIQEDCYFIGQAKIQAETIKWCLEIIDKYISGKEFSFPERENETEAIEEAEAIVKAFKYSLEALDERLEDYEHEQELLEQDMKEGVRGVGITRHCVELSTKKKLISEVLCFMTQAIEDAKKGDI